MCYYSVGKVVLNGESRHVCKTGRFSLYEVIFVNTGNEMMKKNPALGEDAVAFMESFMTPEEIVVSNRRVAIIGESIRARREKGIPQQESEM